MVLRGVPDNRKRHVGDETARSLVKLQGILGQIDQLQEEMGLLSRYRKWWRWPLRLRRSNRREQ